MTLFSTRGIKSQGRYSRREFIMISSIASAGLLAGCAINPVTGQKQLMLVSEEWEIQVDRQNSPHQFSADYGILQDAALNSYIQQVGAEMAPYTHRPKMPYSFHANPTDSLPVNWACWGQVLFWHAIAVTMKERLIIWV